MSFYILGILIVLSVINYFFDRFALNYEKSKRDENADLQKKSSYIERAMADTAAAKDIRLYNLAALFTSIKERLLAQSFKLCTKIKNRYFLFWSFKMLVTVCRDGVAYAYCIWQV